MPYNTDIKCRYIMIYILNSLRIFMRISGRQKEHG